MTVTADSVAASELENVIAVFGAVDRAVEDDKTGATRARVAALIPAYASPRTNWYTAMLKMAEDRSANLPASIGTSEESVAKALQTLTKTPPSTKRLAARRLLGLNAAAWAVPKMFAPQGSLGDLVTRALSAIPPQDSSETSRTTDRAARYLHEFMAEEDPSSVEQPEACWNRIIENARPLVKLSGRERPSCTDRLVDRPGYTGPAAAIRSEFDVTDVEFKNAVKILAPENWPRCMKTFWRCMKPDNEVPNRYHEEVSTNPDHPENAWFTAGAILDFVFDDDDDDDFAITTYDLAPGVEQPRNGLVVDKGSLVVHRLPDGGLHVTTTKRLRLKGAVNGEGLSIVACLFGWTGQGKRMLHDCSELRDDELRHVPRLQDGDSRRSASGRANAGSQRETTRERVGSAGIAQQAAATIKDYVDYQTAYMQDWADRVAGGDYGYGDMADEMARAGVRMVTDSARIMNVAVKNAQRGAAGDRARRPARADEPDGEEERNH